jgi:hypothetical protein
MSQVKDGEDAGFRLREVAGTLVVTFDGPNLPLEVGQPLYRLVEDQGHTQLVLNFDNVRVLTSAPIGMLVNLGMQAGAVGGGGPEDLSGQQDGCRVGDACGAGERFADVCPPGPVHRRYLG